MTIDSNNQLGSSDPRLDETLLTAPKVNIVPHIPAYVRDVPIDTRREPSELDSSGGSQYLLVDAQSTAHGGLQRFRRFAFRFLNTAGIEELSQPQVRFDPQYEKLTWHRFGLHRAGTFHSQLEPKRIQSVRQELSLEENMYDRHLTQVPIPYDVRVGDILEYAYSIDGEPPCFAPHLSLFQDLQWGTPVARLYFRHEHPSSCALETRIIRSAVTPQIERTPDSTIVTIEERDVPTFRDERHLPSWYCEDPYLQISDYQSWNDVAVQVAQLFNQQPSDLTTLQEFVRSITRRVIGKEKVTEELLNFVQREVRYLHVGGGVFNVTPHDPSKVFAQRYGDCKDKSLLLATMLELAGIPAMPALVNTYRGADLPLMLPSPYAFNHAIVCVNIDDTFVWLDPTFSSQYSPIRERQLPKVLYALPVHAGVKTLVPVPFEPTPALRHVREQIEYGLPDYAANVVVTTQAHAIDADCLRSQLAREGKIEIEKQYLEYMQRRMKQVRSTSPLQVEDDHGRNRIKLTERYYVNEFPQVTSRWFRGDWLLASEISGLILFNTVPDRRSPIALTFPANYIHEFELVPVAEEPPDLGPGSTIDNEFFSFTRTVTTTTQPHPVTVVRFEFKTKQDHVPADKLSLYNQEIAKLEKEYGVFFSIWGNRLLSHPYLAQAASAIVTVFVIIIIRLVLSSLRGH